MNRDRGRRLLRPQQACQVGDAYVFIGNDGKPSRYVVSLQGHEAACGGNRIVNAATADRFLQQAGEKPPVSWQRSYDFGIGAIPSQIAFLELVEQASGLRRAA